MAETVGFEPTENAYIRGIFTVYVQIVCSSFDHYILEERIDLPIHSFPFLTECMLVHSLHGMRRLPTASLLGILFGDVQHGHD